MHFTSPIITSAKEAFVPNPEPEMVRRVPPSREPCAGDTLVTVRVYVKSDMLLVLEIE